MDNYQNHIKQGAKDFSKNELRKREALLAKVNKKREYQKEQERQMKLSRLNFNYEPKFMEKVSPTIKSVSNDEEVDESNQNKESIQNEKQKFAKSIEDLMNEDEENFRKNILEYKEYLKIYFQQPDDIAKLHMEDLKNVVETLNKIDSIQTDKVIEASKDKFTPRQWEFIIAVSPSFIKYAPQEVQNKYSNDEKYARFISGEARSKYLSAQIEKVREDINVLKVQFFLVENKQ